MNDIDVWLIGALFYAPIHYLGPLLVIVLNASADDPLFAARIKLTVVECTLTMVAAFGLAALLFRNHPGVTTLVLASAMAVPYLHLWVARQRSRIARRDAH